MAFPLPTKCPQTGHFFELQILKIHYQIEKNFIQSSTSRPAQEPGCRRKSQNLDDAQNRDSGYRQLSAAKLTRMFQSRKKATASVRNVVIVAGTPYLTPAKNNEKPHGRAGCGVHSLYKLVLF
ncbi:hypothetical protein [Shimia sp. MIT1388]|uniref:hypothetical protein n=1 Tax=Shimia sp. MIT1388 TaxID=3096992 RepID=UPI00399A82F0